MIDKFGDGISVKDYLIEKFKDYDKAVSIALSSLEKRLDGMNEFRQTLKDQTARFITREEMDAKIEMVEKTRKDNTALIIATMGIVLGLANIIILLLGKTK